MELNFVSCKIFEKLFCSSTPDLSPPDFFLWVAAKFQVYKNNPKSIAELKTGIKVMCMYVCNV